MTNNYVAPSYFSLLEELALLTAQGTTRIVKCGSKNEIEELEVTSSDGTKDLIFIIRRPGSPQVSQITIEHSPKVGPETKRIFRFTRPVDGTAPQIEEIFER